MARKRKYVSYQDWDKAYRLGVKSFKNDKLKAPAQDEKLLDFIYKGKKRKHKEQIELMEVWGYARDDERAREKGRMKKKQEEVEYFEKYIESFYGKKVLVCRKATERPASNQILVAEPSLLGSLFDEQLEIPLINKECPFGVGDSSERIYSIMKEMNIL